MMLVLSCKPNTLSCQLFAVRGVGLIRAGKEPRRLYYLTEFMICDKDGSGTMSEDECAEVRLLTMFRDLINNVL